MKAAKGDKKYLAEAAFLERLKAHLEEGASARGMEMDEAEAEIMRDIPLLSAKPVIYAANLSEDDFSKDIQNNSFYAEVCAVAARENAQVMPICAKIEEEIADMDAEDKMLFLNELGLETSGLNRIIQTSYALLGLISYLTAGKPEVRAWTIKKGTKAPQAAGKIHTDFERGFIRAEVVSFDDLMACGTMAAAKEKGLVRLEGKEYVVADGDIILFRFNV
jgi:GTP-binding protein YchF